MMIKQQLDKLLFDSRAPEYTAAIKFLIGSKHILDIGCGTGTFLDAWQSKERGSIQGIDINSENVAHAKKNGLNVSQGSALEVPFEDNTFDGIHCSHVMQVFQPHEAQNFIKECARVMTNNSVLVITTLNWYGDFFKHPENVRPYPPDAILRYSYGQEGATSPMYEKMPILRQEDIWFRRPSIINFKSYRNSFLSSLSTRLNHLQMKLYLRKYWSFDAYTIKLRVTKVF